MSSLTKQQQSTLVYIAGFLLSIGLAGGLLYSLGSGRKAVATLKQQVESKENQASPAKPPSSEEQTKWTEQETQINSVLLTEQAVPELMQEITKLAADSGIQQRFTMTTEDQVIDPAKSGSVNQATAAAVGVQRYLAITMRFQGKYEDVARFLGGVSKLPRPVEYQVLDIKRTVPLVDVQVVLNVYKRAAA
jgi:Tfp pilus assembly protein PilO